MTTKFPLISKSSDKSSIHTARFPVDSDSISMTTSPYRIILATSEGSDFFNREFIRTVRSLCSDSNIELTLLHIIPPIPAQFLQLPSIQVLESHWKKQERIQMRTLGAALNIPESRQYMRTGLVHVELRKLAKTLGITRGLTDQLEEINLEENTTTKDQLQFIHDKNLTWHRNTSLLSRLTAHL